MTDEEKENQKLRADILRADLGLTEAKWRFLQGLRYAVFGGIAAALTSLYALYSTTFLTFQGKLPHGVGRTALIVIPMVALVLLAVGRQLELRLRRLYVRCSEHGADTEWELGNPNGIFNTLQRVSRTPGMLPFDHTIAIRIFGDIVAVVWVILLGLAFFAKEGVGQ